MGTQISTFERLLQRAKEGQRSAFDELFVSQASRLQLYVRARMSKRLRNTLDPTDVIQEVFLKAFQNIQVFRGTNEQEFYHWLRWNADHHILDEAKKAATKKRGGGFTRVLSHSGSGTTIMRSIADRNHGPKTSAWIREQSAKLFQTFDLLPAQFQKIITCRHLKGLSSRETAKRLGMRENTVDVYYLRAMRKWRELAKV